MSNPTIDNSTQNDECEEMSFSQRMRSALTTIEVLHRRAAEARTSLLSPVNPTTPSSATGSISATGSTSALPDYVTSVLSNIPANLVMVADSKGYLCTDKIAVLRCLTNHVHKYDIVSTVTVRKLRCQTCSAGTPKIQQLRQHIEMHFNQPFTYTPPPNNHLNSNNSNSKNSNHNNSNHNNARINNSKNTTIKQGAILFVCYPLKIKVTISSSRPITRKTVVDNKKITWVTFTISKSITPTILNELLNRTHDYPQIKKPLHYTASVSDLKQQLLTDKNIDAYISTSSDRSLLFEVACSLH